MSNQDYYGEKGPQQPPQSYQQGPPQQGGGYPNQQQQPYYVQQAPQQQRGGGACAGCPSAGGFFGNCMSMVCAMVCANEIMGAIGQHREKDSERRSRRSDREHDKPPESTSDSINDRIGHASHLFFLDETGDEALLKFSQPYRKELPAYRRASNLVVGDNLRIVPNKEEFEKFLVTLHRVNPSQVSRSIGNSDTDAAYYLKYHQCPKKSLPYYTVTEKKTSNEAADSFISIEDTPSTTDDILKDLMQQRMQIQRDLDIHPTVRQWEQMATIQEAIAILGSSKLKLSEDQKLQSNLAVYSVALKGLPEESDVVLRYMDAFEGLLSLNLGSDVNSKWKSFTAPGQKPPMSLVTDVRIWERRVDALLLDRNSDFTEIYLGLERIFKDLKEWRTDESIDMDPVYHACLKRLFAIWDSLGYTEWTVNLIRALLEQAFFFEYDDSLEDFWKSRQPRLGQPRSKGWKYSSKEPIQLSESQEGQTPFDEVLYEDISPFIQCSQDNLQLLWACLLHLGLIIPGSTLPRSLKFEISEDQLVNDPQVTSPTIHLCELIFREVEDDPAYKEFTTWWGDSDYTAGSTHPLFEVGKKIRSMASRGLSFDPRIFSLLEQFLDTEPGWQLFLTYGQLTGLDCSYILREAVSRIPMSFQWWRAYIESVGEAEKQELVHLALHKLPWSRDLHVWASQCDWVSSDLKEAIKSAIMRRQMNVSLGVLEG
ncbi:hypothetical protein CKK34_6311 [Yarrowia sp. E02]|nr:hypothetical protein CKK34_6311 [Yarrowia sp. E02]